MPLPGHESHGETEQLSLFFSKDWVLTFQEKPGDCLEPVRQRIREGRPRMRAGGADYLSYAILDAVVDAYFPIVDVHSEQLDSLEEEVLGQPDPSIMNRLHRVRRAMQAVARTCRSFREALTALTRHDTPLVSDETRIYLRDCEDHLIRLIDLAEAHRETSASLMDLYLTHVSHRANEIMKVLTIVATIFIPLTFIVGVYGMNFDWMPELRWWWGYPAVMAFMALLSVWMLRTFRQKGWIGRKRGGRDQDSAE
jgi:magnesium transporter